MWHLQELFARTVLAKFYAPLIQFNTRTLRVALQRTNISRSFLQAAGTRLDAGAAFTYEFEDRGRKHKKRCCADFPELIYQDLIGKLDTIFDTTMEIEKSVYKYLREKELNVAYPILRKCLRSDGRHPKAPELWLFPADIDRQRLVQEVEYAQRALQMKTRDHVIHPFQTFLLGTLLINENEVAFRRAIATSFHIPEDDPELAETDSRKSKAVRAFLKAAWFVASTMHDIGYPIQVFEDVSDALRRQIADLLDLDGELVASSQHLRIEGLLYDDPRSVLILRRLALGFYELIKEKVPQSVLRRYGNGDRKQAHAFLSRAFAWLLNRLTFVEMRHEMVSTLAVAMLFLKTNPPGPLTAARFAQATELNPIERHVLLPVMLHHILDWPDLDLQADPDRGGTSPFGGQVLRSLLQILKKPDQAGLMTFRDCPLAVLLAICDLFQEWGRPGGKSTGGFPNHIEGTIDFVDKLPKLTTELLYRGGGVFKDSPPKQQKDFRSRKPRVDRIDALFDRGCLDNLQAEFRCNLRGAQRIRLPRKRKP